MSRPTFLEGAGVALLASVIGGGALALLAPLLGAAAALGLVISGLGLGYLTYLLARARARTGRVSLLVLWATATAAAYLSGISLGWLLAVQLGLVWLTRAIWFQRGPLAAAADLGLIGAGLAASAWAVQHAGSPSLAIWCFALVQAAFVAIPTRRAGGPGDTSGFAGPPGREADPGAAGTSAHTAFQRAHRAAEAAVRRLSAAS